MPLLLYARGRQSSVRRLMLRCGQRARIGSSEWAEMSFPEDSALAAEHFVVSCSQKPVIQSVLPDGLLVQGKRTSQLMLDEHAGKAFEFAAGDTTFAVHWTPDETAASPRLPPASHSKQEPPSIDDSKEIASIIAAMPFSDDGSLLATQPDRHVDFLQRLIDQSLLWDAIALIVCVLPRPISIAWAAQAGCLYKDNSTELATLIQVWLQEHDEPTREPNRLRIANHLATSQPGKPIRWLAQAVVYCGESLAPTGQPIVPPPKYLYAIAVMSSVRWAVASDPDGLGSVCRWIESGVKTINKLSQSTLETS